MKKPASPRRGTASRRAAISKGRLPDQAEYRFASLPDVEVPACEFYEYAREGRLIRDAVAALRKVKAQVKAEAPSDGVYWEAHEGTWRPGQPGEAAGVVVFQAEPSNVSRECRFRLPRFGDGERFAEVIATLAEISGFPDVPWQKLLDGAAKQQFVGVLTREWPEPVPGLILRSGRSEQTLGDFRRDVEYHYPEGAGAAEAFAGFIRIELEYDAAEMVEAFRRQYLALQKKSGVTGSGWRTSKPAEPTLRRLHELGALRLRDPKWGLRSQEAWNALSIYQEKSRYSKACKAAIEHFQKFFALVGSERPIHDSKDFRR